MTGPITLGDDKRFISLLTEQSTKGHKIDALVLDSGGGDVTTGYKLAAIVKTIGMTTVVEGTCASMCVTVFAAGDDRVAVLGSLLGVHSVVSVPDDQTMGVEDEGAMAETVRLVRVMKNDGTPEPVIAKLVSTPSSELTWLDANDTAGWVKTVNAYGVLDGPHRGSVATPETFALSGSIGRWTIRQGEFGESLACGASRSYANGTVLAYYVTPGDRSWLLLSNNSWGWQGSTQVQLNFVDEGVRWAGDYRAFADDTAIILSLDRASARKFMDAETVTALVEGSPATSALSLSDSRAAGKAVAMCASKL